MCPTLPSSLAAALAFALAWLSVPSVLVVLALVALILFGAGRGLGLPRLFWNKKQLPQFAAGAATSALFLEVDLVVYLLDAHRAFQCLEGAAYFSVASLFFWFVLVFVAGVGVRRSRSTEDKPLPEQRTAPAIRQATPTGPSFRRHTGVSPWPFFLGSVTAAIALAVLAWLVLKLPAFAFPACVAKWVDEPAGLDPRLHNVALAGVIGFFALFLFSRKTAPAAVALCCLLALLVAVHGFFTFFLRAAGLEFLALGGFLLFSGRVRYKLRLRDLASDYAGTSLHPYPPPASQPAADLLSFDAPLCVRLGKSAQRPLVVICTSGGGIRAATWTAAILGRLDELPHMRTALSWVSGASGGMVGAAHWLACRVADKAVHWESLAKGVALDSLNDVARTLVFHDVPLAFLPVPNLRDRGQAMQAAWSTHAKSLGGNLAAPLSTLRQGEAEGRWPSLIFSPMLVEDGRRLLLTNVDLSPVTDHYARWLSSEATSDPVTGLASRSAYSLADLVPNALHRVSLATAARLVASFPYASPAVSLPTTPRRRVVDAGYFDNYGLELACGWLRILLERCRESLMAGCSGILVIQIRDNVSELSVNPQTVPELDRLRQTAAEGDTAALRGLEGLTSPPEAVLSARDSATLFRNDAQLEAVSSLYAEAFKHPDFVTTTVFEFAGEASLSWHLDPDEVNSLVDQANSKGIDGKLIAIRRWLAKGTYPPHESPGLPSTGPLVLPGED
jgi:hypothetical protein